MSLQKRFQIGTWIMGRPIISENKGPRRRLLCCDSTGDLTLSLNITFSTTNFALALIETPPRWQQTPWALVPSSQHNAICSIYVAFKHKFNADGSFGKYKARLLAILVAITEGIDFDGGLYLDGRIAFSSWPVIMRQSTLHQPPGPLWTLSPKLGSEMVDPVSDPTLYRSLAGALQYLTFTRPDISYVVQQICLYMHDPRDPYFTALKRILRYVRGTIDHGLQAFWSLHLVTLSRSSAEAEYRWCLRMLCCDCCGFGIFCLQLLTPSLMSSNVKHGSSIYYLVIHASKVYFIGGLTTNLCLWSMQCSKRRVMHDRIKALLRRNLQTCIKMSLCFSSQDS
ncbi:ribonuclease H-like domain-containing protein [Tanacetum coccineum]